MTNKKTSRAVARLLPFLAASLATRAFATPTQDEIVKSFNDNMNQPFDYSLLIPWFFAACGAVVVVVYFQNRQKRKAVPQTLNNPKKLVREIIRNVEIDPAEMKKAAKLAMELNLDNPLTLLICPSLMNQAGEDEKRAESE